MGPYRFCSDGNPTTLSILLWSYLILSDTHVNTLHGMVTNHTQEQLLVDACVSCSEVDSASNFENHQLGSVVHTALYWIIFLLKSLGNDNHMHIVSAEIPKNGLLWVAAYPIEPCFVGYLWGTHGNFVTHRGPMLTWFECSFWQWRKRLHTHAWCRQRAPPPRAF